tara:strand:+ start:3803 stop:5620 length:1818 start_codon:yes stop_codon:yes gene_type:complete
MSSYWANEDKIKVSQTQVSIPSVNGQSYTVTGGQDGPRVDFVIPATTKFFDGKNCYIEYDIKLGLPTGGLPTRLCLDPFIGGQSVIKNLRVYSQNGVLLEEISNYNTKVGIQYSYNADDSLRKIRALKEGCGAPTIENRGTLGTSESNLTDTSSSPYYSPQSAVPAARDFGDADFLFAKLCIPIHSGIFADSSKIFPNMIVGGIRVECDLEDPAKIIKQLDSVNRQRRMLLNPTFHGIDAAGTAFATGATNRTEIFLSQQNNMLSVANCPFVKGERINFCKNNDPADQPRITNAAGAALSPKITDITMDGGFVKLTVETIRNSATNGQEIDGDFIVYSASVDQKVTITGVGDIQPAITSYAPKYEIRDINLVVQQVGVDPRYEAGMLKKMREGGTIELDIHSVTNYKHSLLKDNRNATIDLPLSNTRAKSIIVVPTDSTVYNTAQLVGGFDTYSEETTNKGSNVMDTRLDSIRSGYAGIIDQLTDYQFIIDSKQVPSRPVRVSKINKGVSIAAQPLIETEKALNQAKIVPRSFVDYNRNYLIGRAFALNDGVANLNNKMNQLQLFYNERDVAGVDRPPQKDKLVMSYVFHIRRLTIKGDSVAVGF